MRKCNNCWFYFIHTDKWTATCDLMHSWQLNQLNRVSSKVRHSQVRCALCIYKQTWTGLHTSIVSSFLFIFLVNLWQERNKNVCNSVFLLIVVIIIVIAKSIAITTYSIPDIASALVVFHATIASGNCSIWNWNACHYSTNIAIAVVVALMRLLYYFVCNAHNACCTCCSILLHCDTISCILLALACN